MITHSINNLSFKVTWISLNIPPVSLNLEWSGPSRVGQDINIFQLCHRWSNNEPIANKFAQIKTELTEQLSDTIFF